MSKEKRRELTDDELKLSNANIDFWKDEVEWLEYKIECLQRDVDFGVMVTAKKEIRRKLSEMRKMKTDLEIAKQTIEVTEDQIKNGVKLK